MHILERVIDVEIIVLTVLLHVISTLMNVLFALIGWVIGQSLINFLVDIYSTKSVYLDGLIRMVAVLCVDTHVGSHLLLSTILLILVYQTVRSPQSLEGYMMPVNYTLTELL
jgi:hypothetical protein